MINKQRYSRQREIVLKAVKARCDHPTADQIYLDVRSVDEKISRSTVYRNLNLLAENGDISTVNSPTAERYDFRCEKHYHVICRMCKKVFDAPIEYNPDLNKYVSDETNFKIENHVMIFEGVCPDCQKKLNNI